MTGGEQNVENSSETRYFSRGDGQLGINLDALYGRQKEVAHGNQSFCD